MAPNHPTLVVRAATGSARATLRIFKACTDHGASFLLGLGLRFESLGLRIWDKHHGEN